MIKLYTKTDKIPKREHKCVGLFANIKETLEENHYQYISKYLKSGIVAYIEMPFGHIRYNSLFYG